MKRLLATIGWMTVHTPGALSFGYSFVLMTAAAYGAWLGAHRYQPTVRVLAALVTAVAVGCLWDFVCFHGFRAYMDEARREWDRDRCSTYVPKRRTRR